MASLESRDWHQSVSGTPYTISTERSHLDLRFINEAFGRDDMYWAKPLPIDSLKLMLDKSLTLGLYHGAPGIPPPSTASEPSTPRTSSPTVESSEPGRLKQIGLARFNTDLVSFAYLTDVYVAPSHRGSGLGAWLMECCKEVIDSMPHLRRAALMASPGVGTTYYSKALGFHDASEEAERVVCMTKRGPGSGMGQHATS